MRAVIQRVSNASVAVPAEGYEAAIGRGMLVLAAFTEGDGKQQERVITEADQLLYILSGEFYYCIGEEKVLLRAGDLLFFDGTLPHVPRNSSKSKAVMLVFYFLKSSM